MAQHMGLTMEEITNEYSRFTTPEKYTMMTLWTIFRSLLMMGGHRPENDDLTLQLLTNREVLALSFNSANSREHRAEGDEIVWVAEDPGSDALYLALFNTGERAATLSVALADLGLPNLARIRDFWKQEDLDVAEGAVEASVEPHGAVLLRVSPAA